MTSVERYTGTPRLMMPAFGIGILGLVLTAVGAFVGDARATAHSYLFAFTYWVGISVASIIMVAIFHTAKAKWMTVLRRAMETMAGAVPIFAVLFLGLIPALKHLYPWVPGSELAEHMNALERHHLAEQARLPQPGLLLRAPGHLLRGVDLRQPAPELLEHPPGRDGRAGFSP